MRLSTTLLAFFVSGSALWAQTAQAPDKYKITDAEKAACTTDAIRFCSGTYPDVDRLIACMRINRSSLSSSCRVAFDAGIRRRHL